MNTIRVHIKRIRDKYTLKGGRERVNRYAR